MAKSSSKDNNFWRQTNRSRSSFRRDIEEWFCKAEERIRDALRNIPRQPDDARIFIIFTFSRHFFSFSFRLSARTMMQLIHLWMHVHRAADLPRSNLKVFLLVMNHAWQRIVTRMLIASCAHKRIRHLINFVKRGFLSYIFNKCSFFINILIF